MTAKVSREGGFGDEVQCNNVSESGNAVLKRWQNFVAKDMSTFVDDVKELADKQRSDVQRAFLGLHSPYIVREEYQDRIKSAERRSIINAVKAIVDSVRYRQVLSYRTTPILPCGIFDEAEETDEDLPCMLQTTSNHTASCGVASCQLRVAS